MMSVLEGLWIPLGVVHHTCKSTVLRSIMYRKAHHQKNAVGAAMQAHKALAHEAQDVDRSH